MARHLDGTSLMPTEIKEYPCISITRYNEEILPIILDPILLMDRTSDEDFPVIVKHEGKMIRVGYFNRDIARLAYLAKLIKVTMHISSVESLDASNINNVIHFLKRTKKVL